MTRQRHLLRQAGTARYPRAICAVCADHEWVVDPLHPAREVARLTGWHASGLSGEKGVYPDSHETHGQTAAEWWAAVCRIRRAQGALWIVVERAEITLTLLGLWDVLESGEWKLTGRDERDDCRVAGVPVPIVSGDGGVTGQPGTLATDPGLSAVRGNDGARSGRSDGKRSGADAKPWGSFASGGGSFRAELAHSGQDGTVLVIGAGNYGWEGLIGAGACNERARRLCAGLRDMIGTLRSEGFGALQRTVGSQSLHSYRTAHLHPGIVVHDDAATLEMESDSYYGGRCEAFHVGYVPGRVVALDQTGAYPAVCRDGAVPVELLGYEREPTDGHCRILCRDYLCTAEVTVATEYPDYPYRDPRLGLTVWPIGEFQTTLAHPELVHAVERGRIRAWHRIAWYRGAPALQSWARHILDLRERLRGDTLLSGWAKSLAVCLVGKFGQRNRSWVDGLPPSAKGPWAQWYEKVGEGDYQRWRNVCGFSQTEVVDGWSDEACPAIAAHITSAQRMRLLALMEIAGRNRAYYVDTDSIWTDEVGYERLLAAGMVAERAPGLLGVKGNYTFLRIFGVKHYAHEQGQVAAGVALLPGTADLESGVVYRSGCAKSAPLAGHAPTAERSLDVAFLAERYRHGTVCEDGHVIPLRYG